MASTYAAVGVLAGLMVAAALQVLRPGVTRNDETDQALMEHWGVRGPPTILLIGPDGEERRAQRTTGEVNMNTFAAHLDTAGAP